MSPLEELKAMLASTYPVYQLPSQRDAQLAAIEQLERENAELRKRLDDTSRAVNGLMLFGDAMFEAIADRPSDNCMRKADQWAEYQQRNAGVILRAREWAGREGK
jgi:hypothetical protein